ncbi:MAG: PASTA domain-containing protein [Clostridiales Family XIII bacterium]|jgi:stage V sporulation protein D (sporulation-specific penicillin-binding protein)|nr:PASTA domain-containing protein [Clostridiales Family XIII bacterium]
MAQRRNRKNSKGTAAGVVNIQKRMIVAFAFILLAFTALTFRLGWIQIVASDKYASKAAEYQIKDERITPVRGSILDRNMKELAVSTASYRIWVRLKPYDLESETETAVVETQKKLAAAVIADALGVASEDILAKYNADLTRVRVAKDVTKAQLQVIREGINNQDLSVIEVEENTTRKYPLGTLASHVIGSVNLDGAGQNGVELEYNQYLSGIAGRRIASTDGVGNDLTGGEKALYESTDGLNLVLTIDETIQYYVEEALAKGKEEVDADRMMCVVMDPGNGEILAMAATDPFDPNAPWEPIAEEAQAEFAALAPEDQTAYLSRMWRNPIISDTYDPGSVFKLITVSSALEEGVVTPETEFVCNGSYKVYDRDIRCWNYPSAHGVQTVRNGVLNSCNPVMIQIVQKMGYERFYNYLELFGITEKTGVDLPGEGRPLIQSAEVAGPVGLSTMSFGQGLSVTPIQMVSAVAAIANDGKLMQPHIVKGLANADGEIVTEFPSKIERQVISEETAQEIKGIMEYVAAESPTPAGRIEGYRLGVKTGTTMKLIDGEYSGGAVVGSMTAIAPIDNPRFVILVVADTPKKAHYGNVTAGPTLNTITSEVLRYLNVKPNYTEEEMATMDQGKVSVPDMVGWHYEAAEEALEASGFVVSSEGAGSSGDYEITDQYPKPGTRVEPGSTVFLYPN